MNFFSTFLRIGALALTLWSAATAHAGTYEFRAGARGISVLPTVRAASWTLAGSSAVAQSLGTAYVGQTSPITGAISLKNIGNAAGSLFVPAFGGDNPADFSGVTTCSNIAVNSTCDMTVSFTPTAAGFRSATLTVGGTPVTFTATGTSAVGDGNSTAGACANGAATGCITWNPSGVDSRITLSGSPLLSMSTLDCHGTSACQVKGTKSYSSGKWYWELTITQITTGYGGLLFGIVDPAKYFDQSGDTSVYYYTYQSGYVSVAGASSPVSAGHRVGDVFGFALDMDTRTLRITRNGALVKALVLPAGLLTVTPSAGQDWYLAPNGVKANFGQVNFAYPVPLGYNAGLW